MLPLAPLRILLVAPILFSAFYFLAIGALLFIRATPLMVRATLIAWIITTVTAPLIVATLVFYFSTSDPAVCILLALPALIIFGIWRSTQGYVVIGVTEADLRASLQAALDGVGLPYEESILGFALISLQDNLRVRMSAPLGTAQFQMSSPGHSQELAQIAQGVRDYLHRYAEANQATALLFGLAGLVCLVLAIYQVERF